MIEAGNLMGLMERLHVTGISVTPLRTAAPAYFPWPTLVLDTGEVMGAHKDCCRARTYGAWYRDCFGASIPAEL